MTAYEHLLQCIKSNQTENILVYHGTPTVSGPLSTKVFGYTNNGRSIICVVAVKRVPPGTQHGEMVYKNGAGLPIVAIYVPDIGIPLEAFETIAPEEVLKMAGL